MKAVVQILLYNESFETIDKLLSSLEKVEFDKSNWGLVIVNNVCADVDIASYFENNWLQKIGVTLPKTIFKAQANNGFSGGHNSAYEISKTFAPEYIYLLNGDGHVDPGFLREVIAVAESDKKLAIVQSRIMLDQQQDQYNSCGNALHFLGFGYSLGYKERYKENESLSIPRHNLPMFSASGAGVLIRSSVIEEVGGMFKSLYFMYHEDIDICWRARLLGYEIGYAPKSVMLHHYEFSKSITKFYWMERNRHLTNFINFKIGTLVLMAPAMILMELGTLVFAIKSGWWKEKIKSWIYFLKPSTWNFIKLHRQFVQSNRVIADKIILKHMVGVVDAQEVKSFLTVYVMNPIFAVYFKILKMVVRW